MKEGLTITPDRIEAALRGALPGLTAQLKMAPQPGSLARPTPDDEPRKSGVLLLLYPSAGTGELCLVLTRRTDTVADHKGQISLPGGAMDPADVSTADTALREACEEVGSCSDDLRILGGLSPLYVPPSNFCIHPHVAYIPYRPDFLPQPDEVAELLEVPLSHFLDERNIIVEEWVVRGESKQVPYFNVYGHKVWGATAIILAEFAAVLASIDPAG